MYAKLFLQMYDGTLASNWKGLVTFQQFLILANEDGVVDMTPDAIARRTSIPLDIIEEGIAFLEAPDPRSRTPDRDGRRIEPLDADRGWGWHIVNYAKYRALMAKEQKKEADRARIAEKRRREREEQEQSENINENSDVAECREQSRGVADVAYTEADLSKTLTESENTTSARGACGQLPGSPPPRYGGPPDGCQVFVIDGYRISLPPPRPEHDAYTVQLAQWLGVSLKGKQRPESAAILRRKLSERARVAA